MLYNHLVGHPPYNYKSAKFLLREGLADLSLLSKYTKELVIYDEEYDLLFFRGDLDSYGRWQPETC